MRIFNEDKSTELFNPDQELGYLKKDRLLKEHHEAIPAMVIKSAWEIAQELIAQGKDVNLRSDGKWYVTTVVYPNGGNEEEEIKDEIQEAKASWDEYEDIQVYVPYTVVELAVRKISKLKAKLAATDYNAIKYVEGEMSAEEYAPIKAQRRVWRDEINALEAQIAEEGEV